MNLEIFAMPDWLIPSFVGGLSTIVVMVSVLLVRNRRSLLTYHMTHERIGISTVDEIHGEVSVTVGGNQMQNLYLSNVWLVNRSIRDIENLEVKIISGNNDMQLMSEQTYIEGTANGLEHTTEYREIVNQLLQSIEASQRANAAGDNATASEINSSQAANWRNYLTQRWYEVPVLNRGQTIRFTYLTNVQTNVSPLIVVECQKAGVQVKFKQPYQPVWHLWGVPLIQANLSGMVIGLIVWVYLINSLTSVWLAALLCLLIGFFGNVPGASMIRLYWWVRKRLIG